MTGLDVAGAAATIGAFLLAGWQYVESRRRSRVERERVLLLRERLRSLTVASATAVDTANYLVQRSKEDPVSKPELMSVARIMRGQLSFVVEQLQREERLLDGWRPGKLIASQRPPPREESPNLAQPNRVPGHS
jgi:hypothetical protein